ncbi:MAG TPA: condensation domain-containing protein, partial [Steroidobacteraceae bacterium]
MTLRGSTLPGMLQYRASSASGSAHRPAFSYFGDGEHLTDSVTFADLHQRARQIAAHLQNLIRPGERVLLVYPPGLDFISAFFGTIYAGAIAVPALPPASARTIPRLRVIVEDAQPRIALTSSDALIHIEKSGAGGDAVLTRTSWVATDTLPDASPQWLPPDLRPGDLAFLQYTSGSTGSPKGVMVTHANCLANARSIDTAFPLAPGDSLVSWLPPHHDMGLVGKILFPIYAGHHCVQLPPASFLKRPYRWLKLISDYRAGLTAAPNFAYELCVDRISAAEKQSLDLSSLQFALNGSEPIRPDTLRRFSRAFSPCGFRPESTTPVYGLAESTLLVSADTRKVQATLPSHLAVSKAALAANEIEAPGDRLDTLQVVSVGLAADDHELIIVDPSSFLQQRDGTIGEIWVRGPSVARGYWHRPEESRQTFAARAAGRDDTYLRTGDLGFIHCKQLYIAGRIKDVMIFNGRNVYPQDVEATVEQLDPSFRIAGCAAFSLEETMPAQLVVVQEVEPRKRPQIEALAKTIRAAIAEQHEVIDVAAIVLVRPGKIPRTTSGKIQRARCKSLFLENELDPIGSWTNTAAARAPSAPPTGEIEITIATIWREVLGIERVGRDDHFFELGGHSQAAAQLATRLRQILGIDLSLRDLFAHPTVAALGKLAPSGSAAPASDIRLADRTRPLPLSWAQRRLWFLDQLNPAASAAYHVPTGLHLTGALNRVVLRAALDRILTRHEILRSTFVNAGGEPNQVIAPPNTRFALVERDLREVSGRERRFALDALTQSEVSRPFDLAQGPLIRGQLLQLADHEHILLITQHHIVCDGWSISLLLRELTALYTALSRNLADPLPPLAIQYADYAVWQRHQQGEALEGQVDYWRSQLADAPVLLELPTDHPRPAAQDFAGASVPFALSSELTAGLRAMSQRYGTTVFMTLLAGWSILLARISGQKDLIIGTPVANRQRIEYESLIGLFVNTLALRIRLEDTASVADLLQRVKALTLDAYAHQDVPFERVVEALKLTRSLSYHPVFQVRLAWMHLPAETELALPGLQLERIQIPQTTTPLDLSLVLSDSGAAISGTLEYARALFEPATIERLAGHFQTLLAAMAADAE